MQCNPLPLRPRGLRLSAAAYHKLTVIARLDRAIQHSRDVSA
jgi:hypothetical protein